MRKCHTIFLLYFTSLVKIKPINYSKGLPWWLSGRESTSQCRGTLVQSLSWEDPMEKEMATYSVIFNILPIRMNIKI